MKELSFIPVSFNADTYKGCFLPVKNRKRFVSYPLLICKSIFSKYIVLILLYVSCILFSSCFSTNFKSKYELGQQENI